jgi:hypothetical protein
MFERGKVNGDSSVDLSDAVSILNYGYLGGPAPSRYVTADINDDGLIDLADSSYCLRFLFLEGPPLPFPFFTPGYDPTPGQIARPESSSFDFGGPSTNAAPAGDSVQINVPVLLNATTNVEAWTCSVQAFGGATIIDATTAGTIGPM